MRFLSNLAIGVIASTMATLGLIGAIAWQSGESWSVAVMVAGLLLFGVWFGLTYVFMHRNRPSSSASSVLSSLAFTATLVMVTFFFGWDHMVHLFIYQTGEIVARISLVFFLFAASTSAVTAAVRYAGLDPCKQPENEAEEEQAK